MTRNAADQTMTLIPLSAIFKGDNPRKHFDESELAELTASILANGVVQPIVVRPVDGGYLIVAGERRYRAAIAAHGMDYEIPAVVRDITEDEAEMLALIENSVRADMSVTEEAVAAKKILDKYKDRDEAAAALGWPLSKLNRRIGLLNLVPEAMTALDERRILIGHAELLSAGAQDKQGRILEAIIERGLTVLQVKEMLIKGATGFTTAIFDQSPCQNCHHNSTQQASLFVESIGEGNCTNRVCFEAKTTDKIEAIRAELAEEVQLVKILEIGENGFNRLSADGNLGVGQEQYDQCRACAKFGATVSNMPNEIGRVERSICFDTECYQKSVAERIKAEKKVLSDGLKAIEKAKNTVGEGTTTTPESAGTDTDAASKAQKPTSAGKVAKTAKAKVSELSQRVIDYRRKHVWEKAVKKDLSTNPEKSRAFVFDLMLTGDTTLIKRDSLTAIFAKISGAAYPDSDRFGYDKKVGHPELAYTLSPEQQDKMFCAAAISAVSNTDFKDARMQKLLVFLDTDLTRHFTLGVELFSLLTKSEIEAVCVSLGLDSLVTNYKKVIGGKKDDAIKAILSAQFEFEGAVPNILNY